jgi:hypothetical protein
MVEHQRNIQELRTELQASRWRMHDTLRRLEDQINLPRHLKAEVTAHPWRWVALTLGLGFITGATAPWVLRITNSSVVRRLPGLAVKMAIAGVLATLQTRAFPRIGTTLAAS